MSKNVLVETGAPQISFRNARREDMEAIASLLEHLGYAMSLSRVQRSLEDILTDAGIQTVLATAAGGEILGLMTLRLFPVLRLGGRQLSIEELVVAPQHRGLGVGRQFLQYAGRFARRKGVVRIEVLSSIKRESSKRDFYIKNGFQPAESRVYRIHFGHEDRI